ncbi:MAG: phage head closure protein [Pseudomonadota bacterium]
MKVAAGELDQLIMLESPMVTTDGWGGEVQTWLPEAEAYARVMETPGREFLKGDFRAEEKAVFKVRFREVDSTWRVIWGGRTWRIDSVTGTMREGARWIHCTAQDGAN